MKSLFIASALALAAAGSAQAATNLVINGSFESGTGGLGSFSGWQTQFGDAATFVDSSGQTGNQPGQASSGLWSAYFGSTAASGGATISQSLTTAPGQSYVLTFDLANDNAGQPAANAFVARIDGQTLFSFSQLPRQNYIHETATFTAAGSSSLLSFFGSNDNGYLQLDNVAVTAVPEPLMATQWLAGLLSLGLVLKRRAPRR